MSDELLSAENSRASAPFQFSLRTLLVVTFVTAAGLAVAVPAIKRMIREQEKLKSQMNLKMICLAMCNFHDVHRSFPPASILDGNGRARHSWRVLIVPFIDQNPFYDCYELDEPWDGPNNRLLQNTAMRRGMDGTLMDVTSTRINYRCPAAPADQDDRMTNYVMIVDTDVPPLDATGTPWARWGSKYYAPAGGCVMVVELFPSKIHWMEPRDLSLEEAGRLIEAPSDTRIGRSFVLPESQKAEFLDETETAQRIRAMRHHRAAGAKLVGRQTWRGSPSRSRPRSKT